MIAHNLTAYDLAVVLGACEREFRNDPPMLRAVRELVRQGILEIEKGRRA